MKPFNIFIILSIVSIAAGFIFFKDGVSKLKGGNNPTVSSNSEVLMDLSNYINYSEKNFTISKEKGRTVLFFA
ncbi:MAG: hypothetical protein WEC80_01175, partial [Patescibacteria group bacterium]